MTDDTMTLKNIKLTRTAYTRAVCEEFHESTVMLSSVITLYPSTMLIKSLSIASLLFKCKDTKILRQIQIFRGKSDFSSLFFGFTEIMTNFASETLNN